MNGYTNEEKTRRLEENVDELIRLTTIQNSLIFVIAIVILLPILPLAFVVVIAVLPLLVYFHRSLPRWGRNCGRFIGSLVSGIFSSKSSGR